jgi:shikimate kinase
MRIFLTGFMGSGKTTMGRKLANYLGYQFVDLDKFLEEKAGMSINDFFQLHGETAFREFEKEILQNSSFSENTVIATGGGAPCYFDNMGWMNKNGVTVYLMVPPKGLVDRLKHATDRPLIKGLSEQDLLKFITEKLKDREPFYKQARYIVNGLNLTAEKFASCIELS